MKQWLLLFQAIPRVARQQGPLSLHVGTYPGFRYTRTTCAERYSLCAMKLARAIKGAGQPEIALVPTARPLPRNWTKKRCSRAVVKGGVEASVAYAMLVAGNVSSS
ncbi:hypothetical protein DICSQDRAFT_131865 [Dichomitus squalens LYAD-421 SS1]|uniref:uncharacterized protein n=1 Tax=Dichomitus squalens (strain LYAD-421) TaxID=732165 RepID=UPI00044131E9|nr:uncharacterized protein DICSQDRAFT_131865 [Dichomitus squalens LYAD-421 SS1]EJF65646.1 hypothetical protein DICSQDRAFT_131865 [Dichomitus squalens LYAD-421 SS1]